MDTTYHDQISRLRGEAMAATAALNAALEVYFSALAEVERLRASAEEIRAMESFCDCEVVHDIYSSVPLAKTRGQIVREFIARHTNHDAAAAATTNMVDAAAADAAPRANSVDAQPPTCDGARQSFDSTSTNPPMVTEAEHAFFEMHIGRLKWWSHSSPESKAELETVLGLYTRLTKTK